MPDNFLLYILIASGFIFIPGPNVLVIVSTTLTHGRTRGFQTVMGTSFAMLIQLFVAAIATTGVISLLSEGFLLLKWLGACYLVFIGLKQLFEFSKNHPTKKASGFGSFQRGFLTSLSNPKTILFFGAFLPQFVSNAENYISQLAILSASFWFLAVIIDTVYVLLSSKISGVLSTQPVQRFQKSISGLVLLFAGFWLATSKSE